MDTTARAAIAARLDAVTADFCQIHLDCRGPRYASAEERAELERLENEMYSLRQQLREAEKTTPATDTAERAAASSQNPDAYAGYTNYETASVILSLSNSGNTDEAARAIVAAAWWNASDEVAADHDAIVAPEADAADALRNWLRDEENPLADSPSIFSTLLEHALNRVNWREVAEHFQPDPLPSIEPLPDVDDDAEQETPEADWRQWGRDSED